MRPRPGVVRAAIVGAAIAIVLGAWAIPTFAGRVFIDVNARIVPIGSGPVQGRSVVLPDGSTTDGAYLRVDIEVTNH